ncbi:MAG: DEAD/DEAH box helicase [Methylotetracoccus sp.]
MFNPATSAWFDEQFAAPSEVQRRGWPVLQAGRHALLLAPTGSGKTLAAFLAAIDALTTRHDASGTTIVYVSPLKALAHDIERNLRQPLAGIAAAAERLGLPLRPIRIGVRTGDTPQKERIRQLRDPADILVTTPESLYLLLGSRARESLRGVRTVIVDEVHALAPTKRGAHLALSLERLALLTTSDPQRIGLSATVRPARSVADFLGGDRDVEIVDAGETPRLHLCVSVPHGALERPAPTVPTVDSEPDMQATGFWPAVCAQLLALIRTGRSTIVFVNSRGLCERLTQRLNGEAGEDLVHAHHGSVSQEQRRQIEQDLKDGTIRGIVATSSLELGIDMAAIDRVALVESPGSVARGLQRIGRAGHQLGVASEGWIFPKHPGDLLECAVVARGMLRGDIESVEVPQNALDVLAQQLVAECASEPGTVERLLRWVRRAHPFRTLSPGLLETTLDMLDGRYPSDEFADLRPLLAWDRSTGIVSARRGSAPRARLGGGTIPDRGLYGVHCGRDGPPVGELDEEMVFETHVGDRVLLGATTWRVDEITRDRVIVSPAPGEPGRLPFWRGDGPGRPAELGRALGAMLRAVEALPSDDIARWLSTETPLDAGARDRLARYLAEQRAHCRALPTDRCVSVERFRDELGDWRICILTPFGARVHAPWTMAIQHTLAATTGFDVHAMYSDDGIVLRFADSDELPALEQLLPDPDLIDAALTEQLPHTALFAGLFRENAVRALLLPRGRAGTRHPLWLQRLKAQGLLAAALRFPDFPLLLETYRQALCDQFDVEALKTLMRDIRSRKVRVVDMETRGASPFARSLVFDYVAAFIYQQDTPLAERRAQALTLDRALLAELVGQAELRDLLDADVATARERSLQQLIPHRRARDADELHDLLRRLGDLTEDEIAERCTGDDMRLWLDQLARELRATRLEIAGTARWMAAEDVASYRDAFGLAVPAGLPEQFLRPSSDPATRIVARYARTHGPFPTRQLALRYGISSSLTEELLRHLVHDGRLIHGEMLSGSVETEWCDAGVLRDIKRETLARLRSQAAPLPGPALGVFLPVWHGIPAVRRGIDGLLEAIGQLAGLSLPWSLLSRVVLPARMADFDPLMLDRLAHSGMLIWIGRGRAGPRDGRVALYLRQQAAALLPPAAPLDSMGLADPQRSIVGHLRAHGASFLFELESSARAAGASPTAFREALWDLVWNGLITNDSFAPLRSLGARASGRRGTDASLAGGRWSLIDDLRNPDLSETERVLARAEALLERYGLVSREAVLAEEWPGGYAPVHKVLKAMEDGGRIRRGYFVEGLSGSQFGRVGAIDRLRDCQPAEYLDTTTSEFVTLAAMDPANPYGALLPWPDDEHQPRRNPGSWVVLWRGRPVLYAAQNGRQIRLSADGDSDDTIHAGALQALRRTPMPGRRGSLLIETVNGVPAHASAWSETLRRAGFERDPRGLVAPPV